METLGKSCMPAVLGWLVQVVAFQRPTLIKATTQTRQTLPNTDGSVTGLVRFGHRSGTGMTLITMKLIIKGGNDENRSLKFLSEAWR